MMRIWTLAQTLKNILHHRGRSWAEVFKYRVLRKIIGVREKSNNLKNGWKKRGGGDSEEQC